MQAELIHKQIIPPPIIRLRRAKKRRVGDLSGNLKLKNISQPTPTTATPSTSSNTYAVIAEMTTTITTKGNKVLIEFSANMDFATVSGSCFGKAAIFRDGSQISQDYEFGFSQSAGYSWECAIGITFLDAPTAASHTYDVRWLSENGFTLKNIGTSRSLQVTELG